MIYLEHFQLPNAGIQDAYLSPPLQGYYDMVSYYSDIYPFYTNASIEFYSIDFEPITLLCGSNGCGKSTILNVIGRKLCADRHSLFNSTKHFDAFVDFCKYESAPLLIGEELYKDRKEKGSLMYDISKYTHFITSDDIFKWMLELRMQNEQKLHRSFFDKEDWKMSRRCDKEEPNPNHLDFETGDGAMEYLKYAKMGRLPFRKYMEKAIGKMERGFSNGETALMKISEKLENPGLYILDEPENSMSCEFQMQLAHLIEYFAYEGNCQFIIATHSPFLMAIRGAKIYNLDNVPVNACQWWELDNIKCYVELFKSIPQKI